MLLSLYCPNSFIHFTAMTYSCFTKWSCNCLVNHYLKCVFYLVKEGVYYGKAMIFEVWVFCHSLICIFCHKSVTILISFSELIISRVTAIQNYNWAWFRKYVPSRGAWLIRGNGRRQSFCGRLGRVRKRLPLFGDTDCVIRPNQTEEGVSLFFIGLLLKVSVHEHVTMQKFQQSYRVAQELCVGRKDLTEELEDGM